MAARYYRQNIAQYNPLSFEEMAYAPTMMRANHDALDQAYSTVNTELGQYNALSQDQDFAQQAIDPVSKQLNSMAESLSKDGFDRNKMSEFRKLKSQKDSLFGQTGAVGIAQQRFQAFQQKAQEIKEQYKKNPKIANYWINQLAQSPGLQTDEAGNIINRDLAQIDNVRHYDAKEINDIINTQLGNLKPTLISEYGMSPQSLQGLSSVQDYYVAMEEYGIKPEKAIDVLMSQISPEVRASARQQGMVNYGNADLGEQQLKEQIVGAAFGASGTTRKDYDRKIITNEDRKAAAERNNAMAGLTRTPGPRISREMSDILKTSGLEFNGDDIVESKSVVENFVDFIDTSLQLGGSSLRLGTIGELGKIISEDPSILLHATDPSVMGLKINAAVSTVEQKEKIYEQQREAVKKDMQKSVANYKEAFPHMKNKSNKEVYEAVINSRNNLSEIYTEVLAPKDFDSKLLNEQILGGSSGTGDLHRREVFVQGQSLGIGDEFINTLGYDSFAEFKEKGMPKMEAGVMLAGRTPGSFILNALDSEGNPITAEVQSNSEISEMAVLPSHMMDMVQQGEVFKEMESISPKDPLYGQVNDPDEGNSVYFMFDVNRQEPYYIEAKKGLTPSQLKEFADNNTEEKFTLNEAVNTSIGKIFFNQNDPAAILR